MLLPEELHQRVVHLHDGRLDHDVAEVLRDADVALQDLLDEALVVGDPARHELEQVVVAAADEVALDDLVHGTDAGLEAGEVLQVVVGQRDLREDGDGLAQLGDVDVELLY